MPKDYDEYPRGGRHQGDLVVKPQEYVYILDETKGQVSIIVGPQKMSLAGTDKPVRYDIDERRFVECTPEEAINIFVSAPKGSYVELQNPSMSDPRHPRGGTISPLAELDHGCKVNINGPAFFALWPGQLASVLEGHNLRSNQYLICRVYDDEAAQENLHEAVIKTQTEGEDEGPKTKQPNNSNLLPEGDELVTGKLFIIKGTDVSFFIPPNGIEVLPDNERNYVRSAVTLEQLEYTILLDENGDKRFERGPQVVFPKPTERFLKRKMNNGKPSRRFRALELNEISGIYVKVIAPYTEDGREYKEGEELWITGKEQRIYFPRAEHSLIRYGDREIHYAVAIPRGESKYVLNRDTGEIRTIEGPEMFLPDPRKEVIVRRFLDDDKAQLWFPGNDMVLEYNQALAEAVTSAADGFVTDRQFKKKSGSRSRGFAKGGSGGELAELLSSYSSPHAGALASTTSRGTAPVFDEADLNEAVYDQPDEIVSEKMSRSAKFTKPVAVEIDAKMDGAIKIRPWTGYAIQIVNGLGERRVVVGPSVVQLAYDEELESFSMSTGTPKSADRVKRDVYLRVLNNRVSDQVTVETADMVSVTVTLSYRVNFVGDKNRWFDVENYVQHLCDNMRSMLRNLAKQHDIQSFYSDYINIIRNLITPANAESGEREGRLFQENGMMVTEVEVLGCEIGDVAIQEMLEDAQRRTAETLIELNQNKKLFELDSAKAELDKLRAELKTATTAALEEEARKRMVEEEKTSTTQHAVNVERMKREFTETMTSVGNKAEKEKTEMEVRLARVDDEAKSKAELQKVLDEIHGAEMARNKASHDEKLRVTEAETADYVNRLKAEAQKEVETSGAVQPGLVEALTALGQAGMLEKITKDLAPLAIVKGLSVGGAITQLFEGTPFQATVEKLVENVEGGNGAYGARFTTKRPEHDESRW